MNLDIKKSFQGLNILSGLIDRLTDHGQSNRKNSFDLSLNFSDMLNEKEIQKDLELLNSEKIEVKANVEKALKQTKKIELETSLLKEIEKLNDKQTGTEILKNDNIYDFSFNFETQFDLEKGQFSKKDLDFFNLIIENPNITITDINRQLNQINLTVNNTAENVSYKSLDFSKSLSSLIDYAFTKQKPVRLDFEGHSSVIIKIDKEGKLSAEFMSADKAMEQILRNTIPNLKTKLDSEGLPYKEVSYKDNSKQRKKDKDDENTNQDN